MFRVSDGRDATGTSGSLERIDALKRANKALDAAWMKLLEPYGHCAEDERPEMDPPPEQDEVEPHLYLPDV